MTAGADRRVVTAGAKHRWRLEGIGYLARLYCERCGKYHSEACEKEPCSTKVVTNLTKGTLTKKDTTKMPPIALHEWGFIVSVVGIIAMLLWFFSN